jgi:hypothetical protein
METLFDKFGGIRPMADHLGEAPSTVSGWKIAGRIPAGKQPSVLEKARELGIPVTAHDVVFPLGGEQPDHDDGDTTEPVAASHGKTGDVSAPAVPA